MFRTPVRRSRKLIAVAVATALVGGGIAFGTGIANASAADKPCEQATLKVGTKRADCVVLLKNKLNEKLNANFNTAASNPAAPAFGAVTRSRVYEFQSKYNDLTVDGIVGPKTWAKLLDGSKPAAAPIADAGKKPSTGGTSGGTTKAPAATTVPTKLLADAGDCPKGLITVDVTNDNGAVKFSVYGFNTKANKAGTKEINASAKISSAATKPTRFESVGNRSLTLAKPDGGNNRIAYLAAVPSDYANPYVRVDVAAMKCTAYFNNIDNKVGIDLQLAAPAQTTDPDFK